MLKQEISRIPYQAKHRLSLWLQLHHIPGMQYQSPHLIAPMMVLHFLWIIRAILDGLHCAGRQWGTTDCNKYFTLPLKYPDRYIMVATFLTMSSNITNELAVKIDSRSTARINCSLNEQVTSPQAVWISIGVWWTVGKVSHKGRDCKYSKAKYWLYDFTGFTCRFVWHLLPIWAVSMGVCNPEWLKHAYTCRCWWYEIARCRFGHRCLLVCARQKLNSGDYFTIKMDYLPSPIRLHCLVSPGQSSQPKVIRLDGIPRMALL